MKQIKRKRAYTRPEFRFESFELDTPFASNCMAEKEDMRDLMSLGYFTEEMNCRIPGEMLDSTGKHDTICYHSNVIAAFTS